MDSEQICSPNNPWPNDCHLASVAIVRVWIAPRALTHEPIDLSRRGNLVFDLWGGRRVVVALLAVGDQSMTWVQLANLVARVFYKLADDEDPIRYGDNKHAFSAEISNSTLNVLFHLGFSNPYDQNVDCPGN